MKFWSRTLPALIGLLALIVGAAFFLIASNVLFLQDIGPIYFSRLTGNFSYLIAGIVIFIIGLLLLAVSIRRAPKISAVSQQTQLGELKISYKAIESMILKAAKEIAGIRDTSSHINDTDKGLVIYLKVKAVPDKPIPDLTVELQSNVKEYVEKIGGTSVAEVKVLVENISSEPVNR